VGLTYLLAILVFPEREYGPMPGAEVRDLLIRVTVGYAALATFLVVLAALRLTHRVTGPTQVLESALRAMRSGDYGRRMTLRKRDYLRGLAAEVEALAKHLDAAEHERIATLRVLESCLREKDVDGAREVLARLLGARTPEGVAAP
jgi:HAMP domain-containing protein